MYIKVKNKAQKIVVCVSLFVFSLLSVTANAQCAMCRAALTSEGNTAKAAAVNDGIVYLMVIPYILVAGIGYAIYRMKKNKSS
ncbi:hypothetical protein [Flavobacterium xanthum]|uniref:Virus attachment protein p12 family protein n=1 Tax=Flavobacterium xanthum TaxID=69322 RepID=A0A1M7A1B9_9FLAO|nr:hypothetical protein [Flavobacterium xanthum]SHL36517.1 hypothetical protein SAMN05443669_100650 [Flavobacterium xanthum]